MKPGNHRQGQVDRRGMGRQLRVLICVGFRSAATHLRHIAAIALHLAATGALFPRHGALCHTREQGSCAREQEQDRDEAGQAAHV